MLLLQLALSNLRVHKIRAALTIAAIALSVSLVVAVTSGYASAYAAAHRMLATYMGTTDAQITRRHQSQGGINQDLVAALAEDPDVERVDGRLEVENGLQTGAGVALIGRAAQLVGVDRPHDQRVETLRLEGGRWFNSADGNDAVIDQVAQKRLGVYVGDQFIVPGIDRKLTLRVVGIVRKPGILAEAIQTVYVPLHTLQKFTFPDEPRQVSRVLIDLKRGADHQAFVRRWQPKLADIDPLLRIRLSSENRREMDRNLQGLHMLSYLGGTVSMLAATFIVFSALSMGVAERQRTLGMLRAVGAFRWQLGGLVVTEGLIIAIAGVVVGIPLGILFMNLLAWRFDELFSAGAVLSIEGVAFAAGGSIITALVACMLPALAAMRTSPLEAMVPLAQPSRGWGILICVLVGVALVAVDPIILFGPFNRSFKFYAHFTLGLASLMVGFFLLAPALVWVVERLLGPIVAAMFGLRFALLRQQLSGGIWRAAGTCAALMVGLAVLVVTQTQGTSAISTWELPDKFPDIFIFSGFGLNEAEQQKLALIEGIKPGELMPIAIASPEFGSSIFAIAGAAILPDATMFFGIDPEQAMSMMALDFREGNPEQAKRLLAQGRHVIVTQEFKQLKGLGVGHKIPLKTRKGVVDFTVAGVVWSPGIDVITAFQDLGRQFDQRTVASLFGTLEDAREYFGVTRVHLFAANLQLGIEKARLLGRLQKELAGKGMEAGDVRQIKYSIQRALSRIVLLVSTVAYAAMAVASLGVTNTIMASIRSRRWQFGVLRSIGVTRGMLLRLVLAEAVLLGVVGVGLGLAAGFALVLNARQEWAVMVGFVPPILVPWGTILIGVGVVMLVSLVASLWPATHVARSEPLTLLQAGRAAV
jgi:putative ABC transport system permease protein